LGSDVEGAKELLKSHPNGYGADDAVNWLLSASDLASFEARGADVLA
jgi:hypothetical protein